MKVRKMKVNDDAVSEVIGVLLLISVTILIAGTVVFFLNSAVDLDDTSYDSVVITPLHAGFASKDSGSEKFSRISFELTSGAVLFLDTVSVRLSVLESPNTFVLLDNRESKRFVSAVRGADVVSVGDRFYLYGEKKDGDNLKFGSLSVLPGQHIAFAFYDNKGHALGVGSVVYG